MDFFALWAPPHGPYASPPEFREHYEGRIELPPNALEGLPEEFARLNLPDYYGMVESPHWRRTGNSKMNLLHYDDTYTEQHWQVPYRENPNYGGRRTHTKRKGQENEDCK